MSEPRQTERFWTPGPVLGPLVLLLLVSIAYSTALPNGYTQDDHPAIEWNRLVREPGHLREIFSTNYWWGFEGQRGSLYRPLTVLSHAWVWQRLGPEPLGPHLVNLLLHFLVCLALAGCVGRMPSGETLAFPAAALFAVHPIHSEAVASAVGRAELLAALFVLLSLWFCLGKDRDLEGSTSPMRLGAAAGTAFLAMLSKEVAVPMVVLPFLLDAAQPGARRKLARGLRGTYPALALAAVGYLFLRWKVIGGIGSVTGVPPSDNPLVELSGLERLAAELGVCARAAWILLFPVRLSADYSLGAFPLDHSLLNPLPLVAITLALVLFALLAVSWSRAPAVFVLLIGGCLFFLPASNLVFPIRTILAERTLYLPSIGICALLVWWIHSVPRRWQTVLLASLATVFLVRTAVRNRDWRDERALFGSAVKEYPGSFRAEEGLGEALLAAGRAAEALGPLRRSMEINPRNQLSFIFTARALAALDRRGEAIEVLASGAERHPGFPLIHAELGGLFLLDGRAGEALASFDRVLDLQRGQSARARTGRLKALMALGRWEEGLRELDSGNRLDAGPAEIRQWRSDCASALRRPSSRNGGEATESAARSSSHMSGGR